MKQDNVKKDNNKIMNKKKTIIMIIMITIVIIIMIIPMIRTICRILHRYCWSPVVCCGRIMMMNNY